jgi:S-adenosylmethionine-dependent methyltransferase
MSTGFDDGQERWRARLGTLRQVVRQELVSRQLGLHLPDAPARRILDVGCGQGTQLLDLARRGHDVTGLDSSAVLLADLEQSLRAEAPPVRERVRTVPGDAGDLSRLFAPSSFDVVLCHGVLMYFTDPQPLLRAIGAVVVPDGLVSVLARNGDALALRPALSQDWPAARKAFDDDAYLNRIGVRARADRRSELTASLAEAGLSVLAWYGVRVFTDSADDDAPVPDQLELILECEELAGRTDPYRAVAALTHLIARRAAPD